MFGRCLSLLQSLDVAAPGVPSLLLLLVFVSILVALMQKWSQRKVFEKRETDRHCEDREDPAVVELEAAAAALQVANRPHLQGCFIPSSGKLLRDGEVSKFENETAVGSTVTIHRATWDPALDKSGNYPFGYVFKGRNIKWEVRIQIRFKEMPGGPLRMGIELDEYVPFRGMNKLTMQAVMATLKLIVGDDLHHSIGDDPSQTVGEAERPIFSMPMWAFDQFIETPEGQMPPSLIDPSFMQMGIKREDNVSEFTRTLNATKFRPGPTYSFSFFRLSTLIDNILWQIGNAIPGVAVSFNKFCGRPPVHIAIYTLRPATADKEFEHRLLDSRKCYHFHLAFWSSLCPPPKWRMQQLIDSHEGEDIITLPDEPQWQLSSIWDCCGRH